MSKEPGAVCGVWRAEAGQALQAGFILCQPQSHRILPLGISTKTSGFISYWQGLPSLSLLLNLFFDAKLNQILVQTNQNKWRSPEKTLCWVKITGRGKDMYCFSYNFHVQQANVGHRLLLGCSQNQKWEVTTKMSALLDVFLGGVFRVSSAEHHPLTRRSAAHTPSWNISGGHWSDPVWSKVSRGCCQRTKEWWASRCWLVCFVCGFQWTVWKSFGFELFVCAFHL